MKMIQSTTSWLRLTNLTWRIIGTTRPSASLVSHKHTHAQTHTHTQAAVCCNLSVCVLQRRRLMS